MAAEVVCERLLHARPVDQQGFTVRPRRHGALVRVSRQRSLQHGLIRWGAREALHEIYHAAPGAVLPAPASCLTEDLVGADGLADLGVQLPGLVAGEEISLHQHGSAGAQ